MNFYNTMKKIGHPYNKIWPQIHKDATLLSYWSINTFHSMSSQLSHVELLERYSRRWRWKAFRQVKHGSFTCNYTLYTPTVPQGQGPLYFKSWGSPLELYITEEVLEWDFLSENFLINLAMKISYYWCGNHLLLYN